MAGDPLVAASFPLCAEIADAFLPKLEDTISKTYGCDNGRSQEFHLLASGQLQYPTLRRRSETARILSKIANDDLILISQ
jgi:hypothetical protein